MYVGPEERRLGARMVDADYLERVFENEEVTIYRVR
jgi:hypothetical protein